LRDRQRRGDRRGAGGGDEGDAFHEELSVVMFEYGSLSRVSKPGRDGLTLTAPHSPGHGAMMKRS
jgi:hypothetical protein